MVVAASIRGDARTFPGVIDAGASTAFDLSFGSAGLIEDAARREGIDAVAGYSGRVFRAAITPGRCSK